MKNLYLLLICLFLALGLKGQDSISTESLKIEMAPVFKVKRHTDFLDFWGRNSEKHYAIRVRNKPKFNFTGTQYSIEEYDRSFNLLRETKDPFNSGDFGGSWLYPRRFLALGITDSDIYLFTRGEGSKPKTHSVYRQKIDPFSLGISKKVCEEFISIQDDNFEEHSNGDFVFRSSEDESKNVFVYFYPKSFTSYQFKIFVFDRNWNPLYTRLETLPLLSDLVVVKSVKLSNDGQVHILLKSYKKKKEEYMKGQPNYSLKLLTCKDGESEPLVQNVQPKDYLLHNLRMEMAPNGDLVIAATAVDMLSDAPLKMFCSRLRPADSSIVYTSYGKLPMNAIKKDLEQGVENVPGFAEPQICFADDGSVFCLTDRQTVIRRVKKDHNGNEMFGEYEYRYKYFGIIVSHFDSTGLDDWSKFVFKKQETQSDRALHSSFFAMANHNAVHVFYAAFDDSRGLTLRWPLCLITHQEFKVDGAERSQVIFDVNDWDRRPIFQDAVRMDRDQVVLPVDWRKRAGLISISIKD
ncbi:hypothetical protein [Croceimicrobium hydrocarbonivorans]|uniref:Uncharacterized protein n=1 Tax=Croceimicrobium hydrocarbonivorans TaxID=2761580 RepID=A0A7H0VGQ9_9FLAO|nr:hypothetical protein [Croceimicrobium hydrocarbonivorans]QNR24907.1 hypothetical protein H4K34_03435 [Croceimicrobium hydrocarbonivorans]